MNTQLNFFANSWHAIGSLKENEQLYTSEDTVYRYRRVKLLKNSKNALLQLIHKIIDCVVFIFQLIHRHFHGQTLEKNREDVKKLSISLQEFLINNTTFELSALSLLNEGLSTAIKKGLKNLGGLEEVKNNIAQMLPSIENKIEQLQNERYEQDCIKAEELLTVETQDDLKTIQICQKAAAAVLTKTFGPNAYRKSLKSYRLKHTHLLSGEDFMALATGMAANLTLEQLKETCTESNEEELLPVLLKKRLLKNTPALDGGKRYRKQLQHDLHALQAINSFNQYNPNKASDLIQSASKFSYAEYLARNLAYALFQRPKIKFSDGFLFPMYDKEGSLKIMEAHSLISHKGLHGLLVKPAFPKGNPSLYVVFRGTNCKHSIIRDLNTPLFYGPGRASFQNRQAEICSVIQKHVDGFKEEEIDLEFIGHSLGGSDGMRALHALSALIKKGASHFNAIRLLVFNTPGVEPDITKKFVECAKVHTQIPFALRYFDVCYDPIQEMGAKRLGCTGSYDTLPPNVKVTIFKFNDNKAFPFDEFIFNIYKKGRQFFERSRIAHSYNCFKDVQEGRFIQEIITNNPEDANLKYGADLKKYSYIQSDCMNDHLITEVARVGRTMKRVFHQILNTASFGRLGLYDTSPVYS